MARVALAVLAVSLTGCDSPTTVAPRKADIAPSAQIALPQGAPAKVADDPNLSGWATDGVAAKVAVEKQAEVRVIPLRGAALVKSAGIQPTWCGARIEAVDTQVQSLVLVGTGVTEALSCTGIQGFGRVPAPAGKDRIAFIYKGSSPNADGVITAVVIDRSTPSGRWRVDEDLSYKLDESGTLTTIPAIRAWLTAQDM
jgi:hypothetical protein